MIAVCYNAHLQFSISDCWILFFVSDTIGERPGEIIAPEKVKCLMRKIAMSTDALRNNRYSLCTYRDIPSIEVRMYTTTS